MLRPSTPTHSSIARRPPHHPAFRNVPAPVSVAAEEGDVFVFDDYRCGDDRDRIIDFRPGVDKIDLSRTSKFGGATFDEVRDAMDQIGCDAVIELEAGSIILEGLDAEELDEGDFVL